MGILISCQNLAKAMSHKVLFQDVTLTLGDGERLGIIGPNGAGKSTLLKILAGREVADGGQIVRKKHLKLAFVEQQAIFEGSHSALEILVAEAHRQGVAAEQAELDAQRILSRLGFEDPYRLVSTLSGGWKKRLAIGCALISQPDLVLFDEPTNHLDLRSVLWLEEFLRQANFAWVVVSHDRFFLDRVTQNIVEIHPVYPGGARQDAGNYSQFMDKRGVYLDHLQREQASLANKLRKEDEWLVRQPKARGTKSKSRIDEAMRMKADLQNIQQRLHQSSMDLDFQGSGRKTRQLLALKDIGHSFGERVLFRDLQLVLGPGQILGILGDNGTGKSTLLKIMAQILKPQQGQVTAAPNLEVVYFDQAREVLQGEWTLKKALSDGQDSVIFQDRPIHIVSWARRFKFRAEQLDQPVSMLSGGEQAKVLIARLMLRKADVLLLDEPNNDLDIDTLEILEESLDEFPGAVVIVSHDRYLMDRLCTSYLGLLPEGGIETYASYEQWERTIQEESKAQSKKEKAATSTSSKPKANKAVRLSYNEQREYDRMEAAILEAETELAAAQTAVEEVAGDADTQSLLLASQRLQEAQDKVERFYARWTELEAKMTEAQKN